MFKKLVHLAQDPDLLNSLTVTVGILGGAFFSYLLQLLLGRILSVEDFGIFNFLLSVLYLLSIPASVLNAPLIKEFARLNVSNHKDKIKVLYWLMLGFAIAFGLVCFLLVLLFKSSFSNLFHIQDWNIPLLFGIYLIFYFTNQVTLSFLQGTLKHTLFSIYTVFGSLLRLSVPLILVLGGLKLYGVVGGLIASSIATLLLGLIFIGGTRIESKGDDMRSSLKSLLSLGLPVILLNLAMASMVNIDMVFVKHFFSATEAGYYSGITILGKILLFGIGSISVVMYPTIANLHAQDRKTFPTFKKFLIIQLGAILLGISSYSLLPKFVVTVFFGQKYIQVVEYLPLFSLYMSVYLLANFLCLYALAIEKIKVFLFVLIAVFLQVLLLLIFHNSITQIILANLVGAFLGLSGILVYFKRNLYRL